MGRKYPYLRFPQAMIPKVGKWHEYYLRFPTSASFFCCGRSLQCVAPNIDPASKRFSVTAPGLRLLTIHRGPHHVALPQPRPANESATISALYFPLSRPSLLRTTSLMLRPPPLLSPLATSSQKAILNQLSLASVPTLSPDPELSL